MRAYARLIVAGARRADDVVTFSRAVAAQLEAVGVARGRIHVIREAVDPSFAPALPGTVESVRVRLGIAGPYVLMVGWAQPRKDLATALAAHRRVLPEIPHQLLLVGEPHDTFARVQPPDDPSVVRAGHVSDADLVALLTGAAALLYPSLYEGFGLPPLEAWACGTPALVSDIPGAAREHRRTRAVARGRGYGCLGGSAAAGTARRARGPEPARVDLG